MASDRLCTSHVCLMISITGASRHMACAHGSRQGAQNSMEQGSMCARKHRLVLGWGPPRGVVWSLPQACLPAARGEGRVGGQLSCFRRVSRRGATHIRLIRKSRVPRNLSSPPGSLDGCLIMSGQKQSQRRGLHDNQVLFSCWTKIKN